MIGGIYPLPKNSIRPLYLFTRIISTILFTIPVLLMLRSVFSNFSDLANISEALYFTVMQTAFVCKLGNFMLQSKNMLKVENYLIRKTSACLYSKEEELIMMNVINITKRLYTAIRISSVMGVTFYGLNPLLHRNSDGTMKLPSPMSLPFDPTKYYFAVWSLMIFCAAFGAFVLINLDTMAFLSLSFGIGQIEILKYKFENVIHPVEKESHDVIQKKLKEQAEQLSDIYRLVLLHFSRVK